MIMATFTISIDSYNFLPILSVRSTSSTGRDSSSYRIYSKTFTVHLINQLGHLSSIHFYSSFELNTTTLIPAEYNSFISLFVSVSEHASRRRDVCFKKEFTRFITCMKELSSAYETKEPRQFTSPHRQVAFSNSSRLSLTQL